MIGKERLVERLEHGIQIEEDLAKIIALGLESILKSESVLFSSNYPEGDKKRLLEILSKIQRDTEDHKGKLEEIIKNLKAGEAGGY